MSGTNRYSELDTGLPTGRGGGGGGANGGGSGAGGGADAAAAKAAAAKAKRKKAGDIERMTDQRKPWRRRQRGGRAEL